MNSIHQQNDGSAESWRIFIANRTGDIANLEFRLKRCQREIDDLNMLSDTDVIKRLEMRVYDLSESITQIHAETMGDSVTFVLLPEASRQTFRNESRLVDRADNPLTNFDDEDDNSQSQQSHNR